MCSSSSSLPLLLLFCMLASIHALPDLRTKGNVFRRLHNHGRTAFASNKLQPQGTADSPPSRNSAASATDKVPAPTDATKPFSREDAQNIVRVVYAATFCMMVSLSITSLAPTQYLVGKLGGDTTTSVLSSLTAATAVIEVLFASTFGKYLDKVGRQPALFSMVGVSALSQLLTFLSPGIVTVGLSKCVGMLSIAFFFLTAQAILSDLSKQIAVGASMGRFSACIGGGLSTGVILAGRLPSWQHTYVVGAALGGLNLLWIMANLPETNTSASSTTIPAPNRRVSCTRLLTQHGSRVRILGILLMIMTLPMFMGDIMQVYAKTNWNLSNAQLSNFFALYGVIGILSNTISSGLVVRMGIQKFTCLAILSKIIGSIGTGFLGFTGSVIALIIGFLGTAQSIGVFAALVEEGAKSGLPQGELAGERASLLALLKIFGPLLYSTMYIQGQKLWATTKLPFLFNIGLSLSALGLSVRYLPRKRDPTRR